VGRREIRVHGWKLVGKRDMHLHRQGWGRAVRKLGGGLEQGHLQNPGGTGKYKGASGSGTYTLDPAGFAEPLSGGTYNGKLELP